MSALPHGFTAVRGSDIKRDGMFMELIEPDTGDEVAEVFYCDKDRKMVISLFKELPLDVVEALIERAKRDLPPLKS
jgi:hypothetical protein